MPQTRPDTFIHFPRLPWELKQKVWLASMQEPRSRAVQISSNISLRTYTANLRPKLDCVVSFTGASPPELAVCRQSRDLALKFYEPLLRSPDAGAQEALVRGHRDLKVDLEQDTLVLCISGLLSIHDRLDLARIRHLAFAVDHHEDRFFYQSAQWHILADMPLSQLETLTYVLGETDRFCTETGALLQRPLVTVDSNLADWLDFVRQRTVRCRHQHDVCSMTGIEQNCAFALELKNSFRHFVETHVSGQRWHNLSLRVALAAVQGPSGSGNGALYARYAVDLAPVFGKAADTARKGTIWVMRQICDHHGDALSRYEGLDRLFFRDEDEGGNALGSTDSGYIDPRPAEMNGDRIWRCPSLGDVWAAKFNALKPRAEELRSREQIPSS